MQRFFVVIALLLLSFQPFALRSSEATVDIGLSVGEEGSQSFYFAVGDYFRVPEREVMVIRERHMPDEEIPVVFFIAKKAHVTPGAILDLRLRGSTWLDITLQYGLSPAIFYVPVRETVVIGPPYGKAYGYYKKKPKKQWKKIVLSDDDVINLVNLRFVSEHYGYSPERVIKMRGKGKNFIVINEEVKKEKKEHKGFKQQEEYKGKTNGKEKKDKQKTKGKGHD